jgi:hypothetical protein
MFCFTVTGIYFLLAVYSLYRELKEPPPPTVFIEREIIHVTYTGVEGAFRY